MRICSFLVFLFSSSSVVLAFKIPPVKIETFKPKGIRVSIPDSPGMQLFAFHANVNKEIRLTPGDISADILSAKNGRWSHYDPEVQLNVDDVINYWVFVQYNDMGFRREGLTFRVTELTEYEEIVEPACESSITVTNGKSAACKNTLIFQDEFDDDKVDLTKWNIEHRIPQGPEFEFNSYLNSDEVVYTRESTLFLKPVPVNDVRGTLDLGSGCTGKTADECSAHSQIGTILPPVKSARINSRFSFRYGKVEIRCKMPEGDWIYPILRIEPIDSAGKNCSIWIAYARGNKELTGEQSSNDIGAKLLLGGPVFSAEEPDRSKYLSSERTDDPYNNNYRTFAVVWNSDEITLFIDGRLYGNRNIQEFEELRDGEFKISLGVGVGGQTNFPNGFSSGGVPKPWRNRDRNSIRRFFEDRAHWSSTWKDENSALSVDYIKVWTL